MNKDLKAALFIVSTITVFFLLFIIATAWVISMTGDYLSQLATEKDIVTCNNARFGHETPEMQARCECYYRDNDINCIYVKE